MTEDVIRKLKSVPVLVIGDVMVDEYIIGEVNRISPEAPVPVLLVQQRLKRLGGAGNVVRNLVSLRGQVTLAASVGNDPAGTWLRNECERIGVDVTWLYENSERPTTLKTRIVANSQQIVRVDDECVTSGSDHAQEKLIESLVRVMPEAKAVVISDYAKGFLTEPLLKAVCELSQSEGIPIIVDPKGSDYSRYRGATFITPNLREAALASGLEIRDEKTLAEAGRVLLERTAASGIIITRGREGSTLVTRETSQNFPVRSLEIIDVTGAGDTFLAMFSLALANDLPVDRCVDLAGLAASLVVSKFGAAIVTLPEMSDSLGKSVGSSKALEIGNISEVLQEHRLKKKKITLTCGTFDLLHQGYIHLLRNAAEMGDILVVGVLSHDFESTIFGFKLSFRSTFRTCRDYFRTLICGLCGRVENKLSG